jgi:bacteriocin-like protein
MNSEIRELNIDELDAVSGGMKTQPNTQNNDVIDARGGQFNLLGLVTITLDIKGNPSSITLTP